MPSDVHFTRAQKWDLVRLSAAAVASTVFFTVPMFLAHPPEGGSQVGDHRPGVAEVATGRVSKLHRHRLPTAPTRVRNPWMTRAMFRS